VVFACTSARATIVGLNQIVTPDIQPEGLLSVNFQVEHPALGDSRQILLDLGINKSLEFTYFGGITTGHNAVGAQVALVQKKYFVLSAGTLGLETIAKPQPFLEGGYYFKNGFVVAGIQEQNSDFYGVYGISHRLTPKIQISSDYISGPTHYATLGVVLELTPHLYFNPAIFISNAAPHRAYGYGVLSWDIKVW
jgi:hypothetical protein